MNLRLNLSKMQLQTHLKRFNGETEHVYTFYWCFRVLFDYASISPHLLGGTVRGEPTMKFIVSKEKISETVTKIGRLLSHKSSIAVLAGVLVEARADCILFTASDGTESIFHRIPLADGNELQILEEGKSVFSKDAFEVTKKLKGNITFEATPQQVIVSQEKLSLEFHVMDADEYPTIAVEPTVKPFILEGKLFSEMVSKTTFATSHSDSRPILQGVNMNLSEEHNVFVSTDSHRLSRLTLPGNPTLTPSDELPRAITVPASVLDHALKSFDLSLPVAIFPSPQQIALANGNTILYSRLLEGNFPETNRLIPTEFISELVVNRKEIIESLELLATLGTNNIVELTVNGMFVELKAKGTNAKGSKEIVFESYDGEENFTISFSAAYALSALKTTDYVSIKFKFVGPMRPFLITPVEESNELQLILPVRAA